MCNKVIGCRLLKMNPSGCAPVASIDEALPEIDYRQEPFID